MDLTTITVEDFKNQFPRDFPYLPTWDVADQPYNEGDRVYQPTDKLFYDANLNGVVTEPPSADWTQVDDNIDNYVQDSDIERAFAEAMTNFNQGLFSNDVEIRLAYLYLTAHYLVLDLQTALQGLESKGNHPVNSRSVGSVSENYTIPDAYTEDATFSYYSTTGYGLKYLSFVIPRIVGNVGVACGTTTP